MNLEFCFLLNVILISRLSFTFLDKPIDRRRTIAMTGVQVIGLLAYALGPTWVILAVILVLVNVLFHRLENRSGKINETRLLALAAHVIVLSVFSSPWVGLAFNQGLPDLLGSIQDYSLLLATSASTDWLKVNIIVLGLLFVTNETNMMIRYFFQVTGLSPRMEASGKKGKRTRIDQRALKAGRVIGILERILIYYLVLNAQFAAIGFILAAKSFTRYKELEKRAFAEYVLVGTLLSALLATLTAGAVGLFLS